MKKIYEAIKKEAKKYNIDKIVLFGSRARGDNRDDSDIDLAVFGDLTDDMKAEFSYFIRYDIPVLYKFDVVMVDKDTSPELLKNIDKDGKIIYEKVY